MALDLTIYPDVGVGLLRFGMTRREVVDILAAPDRQVDQDDGSVTDYYTSELLSLSYDGQGELEFIEWHASKSSRLSGVAIEADATAEVIDRLKAVAGEATQDASGVVFEDVCIALYSPGTNIEGVAAYRRGYYDG